MMVWEEPALRRAELRMRPANDYAHQLARLDGAPDQKTTAGALSRIVKKAVPAPQVAA